MANEEIKVVITNQQWCDLMNRIHRGNSCLIQEAQKLGISLKELIAMGDEAHKGGENERWKEWTQTKRESKRRDNQARPRKKKAKKALTPAPGIAAAAPAPAPAPAAPADPMEELLRKKEGIQKELVTCAASLEEANAILDIRQGTLSDAKAVLEKAQQAVQKAEADVSETQQAVRQAQTRQAETQQALQQVEQQIQELKEKSIYLIDPWFNGNLPEYGTFLSTVEMEGVKTQAVPEEYLPEASLEGVLLFDFVPDYKKARVFCGLVAKFELEEKPYHLIVSDERVKELLKMYIGNERVKELLKMYIGK